MNNLTKNILAAIESGHNVAATALAQARMAKAEGKIDGEELDAIIGASREDVEAFAARVNARQAELEQAKKDG